MNVGALGTGLQSLQQGFIQGMQLAQQRRAAQLQEELQRAGLARAERDQGLQEQESLSSHLARARALQLAGVQQMEGTPGGNVELAPGQMGPPAPEQFHPEQLISGFTDPVSGVAIPEMRVKPRTEYGSLQQMLETERAKQAPQLDFFKAREEYNRVPSPIAVPELGIAVGQPVDKDTLTAAFKQRSDARGQESGERASKALEMAANRMSQGEAARGQREQKSTNARDFSNATTLRTEYNKLTEPARVTKRMADTVLQRLNDPALIKSGVFEATLITQLNKVLDPGSVVRESEFDRYSNVGSLRDRMLAKWGRFTAGQRVGPETRKQIIKEIQEIAQITAEWESKTLGQYREIADANGVPWEKVMGASAAKPASKSDGKPTSSGWSIEPVK